MEKRFASAMALISFLAAGVQAADEPSPSRPEVETEIGVYTKKIDGFYGSVVMLTQGKKVQWMGCGDEPENPIPVSELRAWMDKNCFTNEYIAKRPGIQASFIHQSKSDRYLQMYTSLKTSEEIEQESGGNIPNKLGFAASVTISFSYYPADPSHVQALFAYTIFTDGKNPELKSERHTLPRITQGTLPYPEIQSKPIEQ